MNARKIPAKIVAGALIAQAVTCVNVRMDTVDTTVRQT